MPKQRIENPFSPATEPSPDGCTYHYVDPRYGEFARLKTDEKRQAYLDRLDMGLLPAKKPDMALSEQYRNRKSHALDLSRWIKFNTHDGRTLADFWMSIMDGTNPRGNYVDQDGIEHKIPLDLSLEASRLMATHGFARMGQVDEKGKTIAPVQNIQVVYNGDWRTPEAVKTLALDGEGRPVDDPRAS